MGNTSGTGNEDHGWWIESGIAPDLRPAAARLYWRSFGMQIMPFPIPAARGQRFLEVALRSEHALVARDAEGRLIGLAGLRGAAGGVLDASAVKRAPLGLRGRMAAVMAPLFRAGPDTADMVIDGLAVDPGHRRQGVAAALVAQAGLRAADLGYPGLRAEVALRNLAARSLYHRDGMAVVGRYRIGWPWSGRALVMRRDVTAASGLGFRLDPGADDAGHLRQHGKGPA